MKLLRLFWEMFRIALFVVGGGFAIIAVADEVFSRKLKWIGEGELVDQLPLFQMMPGIMAGHAAIYLGRRVAGFTGSCVALAGVALPSIIVFTAVSMGYDAIPLENRWLLAAFEGLRAAMTGIILAMIVRTGRKAICSWRAAVGLALAAILLFVPGVSAINVIFAAILFGICKSFWGLSPWGRGRGLTFRSCSLFAPFIFLKYGAVAFGGGYVLVPMYIHDFVGAAAPYLQLPAEEFANLMALTQMTPGPIGINAATFFGYRLFGLGGALVTTACLLLPGFIILSLALHSLERFKDNRWVRNVLAAIKPVTVALMISALWSFAGMSLWAHEADTLVFHPVSIILAVLAAGLLISRRLSVVRIIFLCAGLAVIVTRLGDWI